MIVKMKDCSDLSLVKGIREEDFRRLIKVKGVDFDEGFLAQLISNYFIQSKNKNGPKLSDALAIYLHESTAGDGKKFKGDALNVFNRFEEKIGDLFLDDLRHFTSGGKPPFEITFDLPDTTEVPNTVHGHPGPQCRLDTYFAGAICPVSASDDFSRYDSTTGACALEKNDTYGYRPRCWYSPKSN